MNDNFVYWKNVWTRKSNSSTQDLKVLDGFESLNISEQEISRNIATYLKLQPADKVLEVGCGAGMISQFLECDYYGVDYSLGMLDKHREILGRVNLFHCEANKLPFPDKFFDKAFSFSVFQYLPTLEYAHDAIAEMMRVTKGNIYVGDIPMTSHSREQLLYRKEDFSEFEAVMPPQYTHPTSQRFDVLRLRQERADNAVS